MMMVSKMVGMALSVEIPLRRMKVMMIMVNIGGMRHSVVNRAGGKIH
jgi:hypothetical protein